MKVFMSWSGARSKAAAELLHDWIKCVIQASRPWISTRGIGRGSVWFNEINNELKDTSVGIICLTHQNKDAPWILFEAGALAKGLTTNKVCTFLVDLVPADIRDPLAQFNHTLPTREGMMSLAATLNSALDVPLDGTTLATVFDAFWAKFEQDFRALLERYPQEVVVEARSENSMLEEILETTRSLGQRMRAIEDRAFDPPRQPFTSRWTANLSDLASVDIRSQPAIVLSELNRGIGILRNLAAVGASRKDAFNELSLSFGADRAGMILKYADEATPPIVYGDDKPIN